jgi:hypothetical protein
MRTPETVQPDSDRQIVLGNVEGNVDVRANEEDFGKISDKTMDLQRQQTEVIDKFEQYGNEIQINKMKNAFDLANNTYLNQAKQTPGVESAQFLPSNETGKYKPFMQDTVKNVLGMAQNDEQKNAIMAHISEANVHNNDILQKHVGEQIYDSAKTQVNARAEQIIQNVPTVINSPSALFSSRNSMADVIRQKNDLEGGTSDTYKATLSTELSKFDSMTLKSLLGGDTPNIAGAQAYYENIKSKGDISTPALNYLGKQVHDAVVTDTTQKWYQQNKSKILDNMGRPDEVKINSDLDKMFTNPEDRAKAQKVIGPMAQADKNAKVESDKSEFEGLKNSFNKASDGATKVLTQLEIQTLAKSWSHDGAGELRNEKFINSFYKLGGSGLTLNFGGDNVIHQNKAFQDARFDIATGQFGSLKDLDALQDNFTGPQFMKLRDDLGKFLTSNPSVGKMAIKKQAELLGRDVYGNDEAGFGSFLHAMNDHADDIGDGDMHKLIPWVKDYLKGEKPDTSTVWQKQVNANIPNETMKGFYTDYGKELTDSLMSGWNASQGKFTQDSMNKIINYFGGPDKMQRFSPTNNALLSIVKWNQENPHSQPIPLTIDSVNAWEKRYENTGGLGFAPPKS